MTAHRHQLRPARICCTQMQQRCAVMRSVAISVWNKTDAGNQN
jgi:hypothetical protein